MYSIIITVPTGTSSPIVTLKIAFFVCSQAKVSNSKVLLLIVISPLEENRLAVVFSASQCPIFEVWIIKSAVSPGSNLPLSFPLLLSSITRFPTVREGAFRIIVNEEFHVSLVSSSISMSNQTICWSGINSSTVKAKASSCVEESCAAILPHS